MENNKSGKVIAIAALVVAVVALSVGFAAFADTLTIDGTAGVSASSADAFDAGDNQANGLRYTGTPTCTLTGGGALETGTYNAGNFTNPDAWAGINVNLGGTSKSVTCTATVTNSSAYIAHITGFSTATGISCTSNGANAAANVTNVCNATNLKVDATISSGSKSDTFTVAHGSNGSSSSTNSVEIPANGGTATVTLVIDYTEAVTDDDVSITIPTITHTYSSAGHTVTP